MHATFQTREGQRFRVQISHRLPHADGPGYALLDLSSWGDITPADCTGHMRGSVGIYVESVEHLDVIAERLAALRRVMVEGVEVSGESGEYRTQVTYRDREEQAARMRDPNYVPTVAEAVADPEGFVAGMTEVCETHHTGGGPVG